MSEIPMGCTDSLSVSKQKQKTIIFKTKSFGTRCNKYTKLENLFVPGLQREPNKTLVIIAQLNKEPSWNVMPT